MWVLDFFVCVALIYVGGKLIDVVGELLNKFLFK
jgi:hypothetical protein